MRYVMTVEVAVTNSNARKLLAPIGMVTPYQRPVRFHVKNASFELSGECNTGQMLALIHPTSDNPIILTYEYCEAVDHYPEEIFRYTSNRYTRASQELAQETSQLYHGAPHSLETITTIVNDVAKKFIYGHPEKRFYDETNEIPYISCGTTEGSCVDINAYLIANLRSAGFETGYITGCFFPEEKKGSAEDTHCWVVTRLNGQTLEWDIAHHLKMGKEMISPGLNPKPGCRVALAHSMGLDLPDLKIKEMKLIDEPVWVDDKGFIEHARIKLNLVKQQN